MICKNCGKENQEGFKFCGFCGKSLTGKITCESCGEEVDEIYNFCPFCSNNMKKATTQKETFYKEFQECKEVKIKQKKERVQHNKLIGILSNSITIALSIGLILILFASIGSRKVLIYDQEFDVTHTSHVNLVDFFDASINGLSDYASEDFEEEFEKLGNQISLDDMFNFDNLFKDINLLNAYIAEDASGIYNVQSVYVYFISILIIAMIGVPLGFMGFAIFNLSTIQYKKNYKLLFLITLILGFLMVFLLRGIGYKTGPATIFYIIFSGVGLLYSYIIEIINIERKFDLKKLVFRLVSTVFLVTLIFLTTSNIASIKKLSEVKDTKSSLNYSHYVMILNGKSENDFLDEIYHIQSSSIIIFASGLSEDSVFPFLYNTDDMNKTYDWVIYFSLLIFLFMTIAFILLLVSLALETARNINIRKSKNPNAILAFIALLFEVLTITVFVISSSYFNESIDYSYRSGFIDYNYELNISAGIIVLSSLTLVFAIYSIVRYFLEKKEFIKS